MWHEIGRVYEYKREIWSPSSCADLSCGDSGFYCPASLGIDAPKNDFKIRSSLPSEDESLTQTSISATATVQA